MEQEFDYKDFFLNESDENYYAIKIISEDKDICLHTEYHCDGAEIIMRQLFSDFDEDFSENPYWTGVVNRRGCIAMQIIKRKFIIVNIPDEINDYQLSRLFDFYQQMIAINSVLRKTGEEIDIQTNVINNGQFLNLGNALMILNKKKKTLKLKR